ncbi:hypothetical protein QAD02_016207 [Eretmocerus hayati]|uniref:Uncharacterized protein n=1 Tax=Eretmocerus hayati TaxID=131215 RepID=A0ACC2PAH6_9HYME|nr:hypothetical protein QAD02_016207 [Eretmocerus hayati]
MIRNGITFGLLVAVVAAYSSSSYSGMYPSGYMGHSYNYPEGYSKNYPEGYSKSYPEGYFKNYFKGYYPKSYPEGYSKSYPEGYHKSYPEGYSKSYPEGYHKSYPEGYYKSHPEGFLKSSPEGYSKSYHEGYSKNYHEGYTGSYSPSYPSSHPAGYSGSYPMGYPVGYPAGYHGPYPASHYHTMTADAEYLAKQKKIFELFYYVAQNVMTDAEYYEVGHSYDIFNSAEYYTNKEVFYLFLHYYKVGFLHKESLFSYYNDEHKDEMMMLYKLFYFAKDFDVFYKTAAWARLHMNPGMFVTAFSAAVLYRDDTKYIKLPAIYEIYPYHFFNSKVIQHAHEFKMSYGPNYHNYPAIKHEGEGDVPSYYIYSNYSEFFYGQYYDDEYKLNYFYEDVDLNAWYYYFRMAFPFWSDTKYYNLPSSFRGDVYYFFHKQLMSRYYLERLSNGLDEIENFAWDKMHLPAYYSNIMYGNGVSQPARDWWSAVPTYKYKYVEYIKVLEQRIWDAIDSGYIYNGAGKQVSLYSPEGLNYLANIIEGNYDSYNYNYYGSYDALARNILGHSHWPNNKDLMVPSSLQYFSTSLRDPAFYRIYDKILSFFMKYKSHLPYYSHSELDFPGVSIQSVEVDKLVTYFDYKDYYINNAVAADSYKEGSSYSLKAWHYFLNYKPFSYKFNINSDKDTKAIMYMFLGPAFDGENYNFYNYFINYYQYFFQLDEFEVSLKSGMNSFEHFSYESPYFMQDYMSGDKIYDKIRNAAAGSESYTYSNQMWGFPSHMMLPKGTVDGMKYKMFFYIAPYVEGKQYEMPIFGNFSYHGRSFGYPLDRPVPAWFMDLSNVYFKDVFIYHVKDYEHPHSYKY